MDTSFLTDMVFPQVGEENSLLLLKLVSKDEVFKALRDTPSFNALGVDGFQPFFFKKYWHVVEMRFGN